MSASSKYDLSSGNPDRPLYASGRRGTYGVENPLLSSLPSMTRSSSSVAQGDVLNFFQCVRLDPMSLVVEHKLNKPAGFKRLASASVGIPLEGSLPASSKSKPLSSPSPEDLRRLKSGARESGTKARERVKIFNDCLSVVNKCFPIIPSRKRSRLDALSNDRSNTLLSIDRSASEMGSGKMGSKNYASTRDLDLELQKSKVKTKNATPCKRARTSIAGARMDVRAHSPARPSGTKDKERGVVRLSNSSAVQGDDRTLSIAVDGWESPKMKKKRTGIKLDIATSSMTSKPVDVYRVSKQGMQPRLSAKARPRLTDAHGFRIVDGGVGVGKTEAALQTSSGMHSSFSRGDADNSSLLTERREHQEKERVNLKIVNRANSREDLSSGSPTSGPKLNSNVRAPRSSSVGGVSKLLQAVQRSTSSNDQELSSCTSKLPSLLGANNHKHEPSTQPSSSPVANWVQRPQKISRTARRNIILPILPRNDDIPAEDETSGLMVNERRFPALSPQQVRIKPDNSSPAVLSESEESGANEIKSRGMNKKCNEIDENSGHNVQKMSTLLLPQRKSKAVNGNDHGDGVRRQGRTGRRFTSPRSLLPLTVEKLGSVGTNKQIRNSRLGLEKTESRAVGVPTRKLSDRKAYTREKHIAINMPADLLVGSGDGREVLFTAANAVINTAQALSSPFWKKMEHLFLFISDTDISYLKDQINLDSAVDTPAPAPLDADSYTFMPNGCGLSEFGIEEIERGSLEPSLAHSAPPNGISLYQRLIAALIPEEENQELLCGGKELKYDVYGSRCDMGFELSGYPASNGYGVNTNRRSSYEPDQAMQDHNNVSIPDVGFSPRYDHLQNGLLAEQLMPATICTQYQYHNTSMSAKLLMEVQSIGIFPNLVSGDKEISGDISRLDEKFLEQDMDESVGLQSIIVLALKVIAMGTSVVMEMNLSGSCGNHALSLVTHETCDFLVVNTSMQNQSRVKISAFEFFCMLKRNPSSGRSGVDDTVSRKKDLLGKLLSSASEAKELQEREFEGRALDKLVGLAYEKYMSCWGPNAHGMKSVNVEMAKQAALAFVKWSLERYEEFEVTGKSCFSEPLYRDMFLSGVSLNCTNNNESGKHNLDTFGSPAEIRSSAPMSTQQRQQSPSNQEICSDEVLLLNDPGVEQHTDSWPNRVKKRELLLDDVGGTIRSAKGRRSEREREGKGNLSRNGTIKIGRPTVKGERKSKAKPNKQKTAHLADASVNDTLGKISEIDKDKNEYNPDMLEDPIDLSSLPLPEMDGLGVPSDLGGQGDDLGSWFGDEDHGLQDHDYLDGLMVPCDDLADFSMLGV
ncbi:hypothetical protein BUALT_Bualt16G0047700 [Buddleja alternifolia]|uniref:Uncharacterized protein n=1 Tax=Buddleja alternifolia TaxID=168488 RepID=A0AAV6W926_9LAMI|nr:hypothetical protein BUALT_Bualt16G0047700 [Buddleja alternifolia]